MALEDLAAMRAVHGSTVLYPSEAVSGAHLTGQMANQGGIVYLRTTRGAYPVLYDNDESFTIGGSKTLRQGPNDQVTIVAAGVTVHHALQAADELAADGVSARVIDAYSVKPIDHDTIAAAVQATGGRLVVAEDHYPEGGLGAAVLESLTPDGRPLRLAHCAVRGLPGSGKPEELMDAAGISARHIAAAARRLVSDS
jgi:transketolase